MIKIFIHPVKYPAALSIDQDWAYLWFNSMMISIQYFENSNEFVDMDNLQTHYFDNSGLFLAALDDGRLIGTGAIRKLDEKIAELKRIWLLDEYQGQGIGFQLVARLFNFASAHGYQYIRLQTSPQQKRAVAFYKKFGFLNIPCYNED